jgi:hypothetical protein
MDMPNATTLQAAKFRLICLSSHWVSFSALMLSPHQLAVTTFVVVAQARFISRPSEHLGPDAASFEGMGLGDDLRNSIRTDNPGKAAIGADRSMSQIWYLAIGRAWLTVIGLAGHEVAFSETAGANLASSSSSSSSVLFRCQGSRYW